MLALSRHLFVMSMLRIDDSVYAYSTLPSFLEAQKSLMSSKHYIDVLGQVILQKGFADFLGLSLLHKHFPTTQNELLVKTIEEKFAYLEPVSLSSLATLNILPCSWKIVRNEVYELVPIEFFVDQLGVHLEIVELIYNAIDFLECIGKTLFENKLQDIFGISLLTPERAKLPQGFTLLESSEANARKLTLSPIDPLFLAPNAPETLWTFRRDNESSSICLSHCQSHCACTMAVN
jgi:hypothetical protein